MGQFSRLQLLLANSIAVGIAIVCAYAVQQLLITTFQVETATATFAFGLTLPVILILLQWLISKLVRHDTLTFAQLVYRSKLNPLTLESINIFKGSIQRNLHDQFQIDQFILYVFDWQRNTYFECCPRDSAVTHVLPANHALVKFSAEYRTVYCTDRHLPEEDFLSDTALTEITTFMRRHKYVFAIPLATATDVYGFLFLTLEQVKDSRIYAAPTFTEFTTFGKTFGSLLQKILIYDAIVLKGTK